MNERDRKIEVIEGFTELNNKKVDNYDRYNYYLNITGRKVPALIVMELTHTGNGYINGKYINTNDYETTKLGDVNIKNFADAEIIKLIEESIRNLKNEFK